MCDSTLWAHITWDRVGWAGDDDVLWHLHTCEILHFGYTSWDRVGWAGDDDVLWHLHTCVILHFGHTSHGIGWGGVGMMTFVCTCTHV